MLYDLYEAAVGVGIYLKAHNWQKWKSTFPTYPCHESYEEETVGVKSCSYTFKINDFWEYVKFGVISWHFDILSITAFCFFTIKSPSFI